MDILQRTHTHTPAHGGRKEGGQGKVKRGRRRRRTAETVARRDVVGVRLRHHCVSRIFVNKMGFMNI